MKTAYINARVYTGYEQLSEMAILDNDGIIEDLCPISAIPEGYELEDMQGLNMAPALIDLQIYGGNGSLFLNDLSVESLKATYEYCLSGGAAFFMITIPSAPIDTFLKGMDIVREYQSAGGKGLLGLHMEGPYMNPAKRGAHGTHLLKTASLKEVEMLLERGKDVLKMITLAPELCDPEIIRYLIENNIIVSAGHSNAGYPEAMAGFELGIPTSTHLFNAMSPFLSREPGLVGAILDHPGAMASVICDGVHVDFSSLRICKQIMKDRMFYITDAVAAAETGEYPHVFKGDRYTMPDGTLSGSALTMMKSVQLGMQHLRISLEESLRMASTYPARLLRSYRKLGHIAKGYESGFIVFDDDLNLKGLKGI